MSTISVSCEQVGLTYRTFSNSRRRRRTIQVQALRGIDFSVNRGESIGIVGHNGSGKSTLLKIITGLLLPSSGQVLVSSQPRLLGVNAALNRQLSGRQNIEIGCLALGLSRDAVGTVAGDVAAFTELGDFLDLPVASYSAGMRQRLAFSISAVVRPEIVLVDEALSVGDRQFKDKCLDRLNEIRDSAGVVIIATHAMSEITRTCSRALWLHQGEIVADGDAKSVVDEYETSRRAINRSLG